MYRACLARQINEVEGLKAMFCGQDELTLWNPTEYDSLKVCPPSLFSHLFLSFATLPSPFFSFPLPTYLFSSSTLLSSCPFSLLHFFSFPPSSYHSFSYFSFRILWKVKEVALTEERSSHRLPSSCNFPSPLPLPSPPPSSSRPL